MLRKVAESRVHRGDGGVVGTTAQGSQGLQLIFLRGVVGKLDGVMTGGRRISGIPGDSVDADTGPGDWHTVTSSSIKLGIWEMAVRMICHHQRLLRTTEVVLCATWFPLGLGTGI